MVDLIRNTKQHGGVVEGRVELVHLTAFGTASLSNKVEEKEKEKEKEIIGAPRPSSTPTPSDRGPLEGRNSLISRTDPPLSLEAQIEGNLAAFDRWIDRCNTVALSPIQPERILIIFVLTA